jgi:hypothetical protein
LAIVEIYKCGAVERTAKEAREKRPVVLDEVEEVHMESGWFNGAGLFWSEYLESD